MAGPLHLTRFFLDDRLAEGRGDRTALVLPDHAVTYAEVAAAAGRAAAALVARGVHRGDRVLLLLPDGLGFVAALFGAARIGAIVVMANPEAPDAEQAAIARYVEPRVVVGRDVSEHDLLAHRLAPPPFTDGTDDDEVLWLLTSGSTGEPRAAVHRHRDFAEHARLFGVGFLGIREDDVTYAVPRLHFPYATGMNLFYPFLVGARAALVPQRPTAADVFRDVRRVGATVLVSVPTMAAKMLAEPAPTGALATVRLATSAGEALPADLFTRFRDRHGIELCDVLGSAEMFHVYVGNRPGHARAGSLGEPVPGYTLRVVRDDGQDASPGEPGLLWVRGPSAGLRYHDDPERSTAVFRADGWVVSGDFVRREADGRFTYEGRADDMLKVSGLYVSPLEVEAVVRTHPAVDDCAVVGWQDEHGLCRPRAVLVLREPATPALLAELEAHARAGLAGYKVPRAWDVVPTLPRNDRGKLVRRLLRGKEGR